MTRPLHFLTALALLLPLPLSAQSIHLQLQGPQTAQRQADAELLNGSLAPSGQTAPANAADVLELVFIQNGHEELRTSAWLTQDGQVVNTAAGELVLPSTLQGQAMQIAVVHRNHLPVMSAQPVSLDASLALDLTDPSQLAEGSAYEQIGGKARLVAGNVHDDANDRHEINAMDVYKIRQAVNSGNDAPTFDLNADGRVDQTDLNLVIQNNNRLRSSQLPAIQ